MTTNRRAGTLRLALATAALMLVPSIATAQETPTSRPATTAATQQAVRSPEVNPDRSVTFRVRLPSDVKSAQVNLGAIGGGKFIEMKRSDTGTVWSVTTPPLEPDVYEYFFRADGVKFLDPADNWIKDRTASLIEVPGTPPPVWQAQQVPHGTVHVHRYDSKSLGGIARRVHVYTPPGYESAANANVKYPVLYLLHGSGDDDAGWVNVGRAAEILDNLIAAGKAKPMVVVMPYGHVPRGRTATTQPGINVTMRAPTTGPSGNAEFLQLFERDLLSDVLPLVESTYRVYTDAKHRGITGLSMGGAQTIRVALAHPDLFAYVCPMSAGGLRGEDFDANFPALAKNPDLANANFKLLWIGVGDKDGLVKFNKAFDAWLTSRNIKHELEVTPGAAHTWFLWRRYLAEVASRVFQD